jgi:hypothetical protein
VRRGARLHEVAIHLRLPACGAASSRVEPDFFFPRLDDDGGGAPAAQ